VKEVEWTDASLDDMAALDKGMARRVKEAVERFAETGAGNVKKLQGIDPREYRPRVGDSRVRFGIGGPDRSRSPRAEPPRSLPLSRYCLGGQEIVSYQF